MSFPPPLSSHRRWFGDSLA